MAGTGSQVMKKYVPRIKFPQRRQKSSSGGASSAAEVTFFKPSAATQATTSSPSGEVRSYRYRSDVPAPPSNTAVGGQASLLPKRKAVSDKEIEAILSELDPVTIKSKK